MKGLCIECSLPLEFTEPIGYHSDCVKQVHARIDNEFLFSVVGYDEIEIDSFKTYDAACKYLYNLHNAKIKNR